MSQTRIAGLDGLRALAVIAVMLFHADYQAARGGFLGVDLFFVISGFLITRLLLGDIEDSGTIDLVSFYMRRIKRILPAMLTVIATTMLACYVLRPEALNSLRSDALASLLFIANWYFQLQGISYFEKFQGLQMLQHLWSVSVEEQFYAFWPFALLIIAKPWGRGVLGLIAAKLAIASALWMGWLASANGFPESMDIDRVYLGTDTHAFGLLIGAVVACCEKRLKLFVSRYSMRRIQSGATSLGLCLLVALLLALSQIGENHRLLYPGGFMLASLLAAGLIMVCVMSPRVGHWLEPWPLRWIGKRSYGFYLWHWPVFSLTRPGLDLDLNAQECFMLRAMLTTILAAASYSLIESPILARSGEDLAARRRIASILLSGSLATGVLVYLLPAPLRQLTEPPLHQDPMLHQDPILLQTEASVDALSHWRSAQLQLRLRSYDLGRWQGNASSNKTSPVHQASERPEPSSASIEPARTDWSGFLAYAIASRLDLGLAGKPREPVWQGQNVEAPPPKPTMPSSGNQNQSVDKAPAPSVSSALPPIAAPRAMSVFGDSVVLGARPMLEQVNGQVRVYAEVGWQASDIVQSIKRVRDAGELQALVVVHLGTNGYVTEKQLRAVLDLLLDRERVLLINTRVPKRWMSENNALFETVVATYSHVELIDWFSLADRRSDFFVSDGVHLTQAGMRAFAEAMGISRLVANAR